MIKGDMADYRDRGLVVLGFPCDQFGRQEPGSEESIQAFCTLDYGVDVPMSAKVEVNGRGAHPLWAWLGRERAGLLGIVAIKWNFTRFLVGCDGQVLSRHAPTLAPEALRAPIQAALG